MFRRYLLTVSIVLGLTANSLQAQLPDLVKGADTAEDLYSPVTAGSGAFSTSLGGGFGKCGESRGRGRGPAYRL
ncbi:hypothetical protein AGMMS49991_06550 [Spirochaetia bacterium]|nr:hypothetical protein AGMMS49991_06550 [Spirochaetia bacterium]